MPAAPVLPGLDAVDAPVLQRFQDAFTAYQRAKQELWDATVAAYETAPEREKDFVDDELALVMNVHPRTAEKLVIDACTGYDLPALIHHWHAGQLTDRHVTAAVEQLHACLSEHHQRVAVLDRVLDTCRRRAAQGRGWPTPGELKQMIKVAALLVDPHGAQQRKDAATERRGAHASALPDGQAMLALEGPEERVVGMIEALRARTATQAAQPGETRTREQLEFDLAEQLLLGGTLDGQDPVDVEMQVVVPIDTATGDGQELGELPGLGPILPGTCRDLLARAGTLRRICTDARTGQVIAVDEPIPVHRDPDAIAAALEAMRTAPLVLPDLTGQAYRPTAKALRFVRLRDRTCRFPGCTRPARFTDVDHRLPWPLGPTDPRNLHCLCRHHHRAKQSGLFTVTTDPDGSTAWTLTRTGQVHRRPPPQLTGTW